MSGNLGVVRYNCQLLFPFICKFEVKIAEFLQ